MDNLERKGIINQFWDERTDYGYKAFQIIDNSFKGQADYKKGYLNLNYEVLHSKEFLQMSRSEKVIILRILKIMNLSAGKGAGKAGKGYRPGAGQLNGAGRLNEGNINSDSDRLNESSSNNNPDVKLLSDSGNLNTTQPNNANNGNIDNPNTRHIPLRFDTLMDWTGKSLRSVRKMVEKLSKFIKITLEKVKIQIDISYPSFHLPNRREVDEQGCEAKESDIKNKHILSHVLRKTKETISVDDTNAILSIIRKYGIDSFFTISRLLIKTIRSCGWLSPSFFHMLARAAAGLAL